MKDNKAGPLFGAGLIGGGIGFLIYQKTGNLLMSSAAAITILVVDYALIVQINKWKERRDAKRKANR